MSLSQRHTFQRLAAKTRRGRKQCCTRRTAPPFVSPLTVCPRAAGSFALPVHTGHNINSSIPGSNSNRSALVAGAQRQLVHFPPRPPRRRPTTAAPSSLPTLTCASTSVPSPSSRASPAPPSSLNSLALGRVTTGSVRRRKNKGVATV